MKISYHESFRKHFRRAYCVLGMDYKLVIQRWKRPRFRLVAPLEFLSRSLRITIREQRDLSRSCVYMSGKVFVFVFYFFFNLDYMLLFKGFWRYLHSSHKTEKISVIFISKKKGFGESYWWKLWKSWNFLFHTRWYHHYFYTRGPWS